VARVDLSNCAEREITIATPVRVFEHCYRMVAELPATRMPGPGAREGEWNGVRSRALTFLDTMGHLAGGLGWTVLDLLAVHPVVGVARVDYCGALLLGCGSPVQLITAETIVYVNGLKFRRGRMPVDAVPVWAWGESSPALDLQGTRA
jgi:hypothetical protein